MTAWPKNTKYHVEGETKVYINGPGYMTKVATMPIYRYGKTFKNLFLQNRKYHDLETGHAGLKPQVLEVM